MVITNAFLSQSIKKERENWDNCNRITFFLNRVETCKCKKWRTFPIKKNFLWQNYFN